MEEVIRAGNDDDRQILGTRPVEHACKRHRLVDFTVYHDRVRRDVRGVVLALAEVAAAARTSLGKDRLDLCRLYKLLAMALAWFSFFLPFLLLLLLIDISKKWFNFGMATE